MAIYPYICDGCGKNEEVIQSITSYIEQPRIPDCCEVKMRRVFTPLLMSMDFEPFVSTIDGTIINSRSDRREHMSRHGVVPFDDIAPDITRNKKYMQDSFKKDVKSDILEAVHKVESGYNPRIENEVAIIPSE